MRTLRKLLNHATVSIRSAQLVADLDRRGSESRRSLLRPLRQIPPRRKPWGFCFFWGTPRRQAYAEGESENPPQVAESRYRFDSLGATCCRSGSAGFRIPSELAQNCGERGGGAEDDDLHGEYLPFLCILRMKCRTGAVTVSI